MLDLPALLRRAALTEDDLLRYVNYPRAQAVAARDKAVAVTLWGVVDALRESSGMHSRPLSRKAVMDEADYLEADLRTAGVERWPDDAS